MDGGVRSAWAARVEGLGERLSAEDLVQVGNWIVEVASVLSSLSASAAALAKEASHSRLNLLRKGGREAFAFVKEASTVRRDVLGADMFGQSSAQSVVEAELEKWRITCWLAAAST